MHGTADITLESTRHRKRHRLLLNRLTDRTRAAKIIQFRRAFYQTLLAHKIRGIYRFAKTVERRFQHLPAPGGKPIGIVLDTDALAAHTLTLEHIAHIVTRVLVLRVHPDANVINYRSVSRLDPVGGARHQDQTTIKPQEQCLEQHETIGVITAEVIHALLLEQQ